MSQAVIGIVSDLVRADHLVKCLVSSGFGCGAISVLCPDNPLSHIRCEKHNKSSEYAILGTTLGGGLGASLGFLAKSAFLSILGAGQLENAGSVIPVLCGVGIGALAGLLIGGAIGLFLPKYEIRQFAGFLSGGNVLVSVHIDETDQLNLAREIFESAQADDIHCVREELPHPYLSLQSEF